jgi:hypothetical protein
MMMHKAFSILNQRIKQFRELANMPGNDPIRCSRMHFNEWQEELQHVESRLAWVTIFATCLLVACLLLIILNY